MYICILHHFGDSDDKHPQTSSTYSSFFFIFFARSYFIRCKFGAVSLDNTIVQGNDNGIVAQQRTGISRLYSPLSFNGPGAAPRQQFGIGEQYSLPPDPADVCRIGFQGNLSTVLDRMTPPYGVGWFVRKMFSPVRLRE